MEGIHSKTPSENMHSTQPDCFSFLKSRTLVFLLKYKTHFTASLWRMWIVSICHYSCALGPLLSKIKVTSIQTVWYLNRQSDNQVTYWVTNRQASSEYSMDISDYGMIHVHPGQDDQERKISSHYSERCTIKELWTISGIFHLRVYLDHGWPWVIETVESETTAKQELLYTQLKWVFSLILP